MSTSNTIGNLNKFANLLFIIRFLPILFVGINLLREKNKNPEKKEAAKSFLLSTIIAITGVILVLFFITISILKMVNSSEFSARYKRYGVIVENKIKYTQNTTQYKTLEEVGLKSSQVNENEEILLSFDHQDNLIKATPMKMVKQESKQIMIFFLSSFLGGSLFLMLMAIYLQHNIGKAWFLYINKYHSNLLWWK